MPWEIGEKDVFPSKYVIPTWVYIFTEEQLSYAKLKRKELGQLREEFLEYQKLCGKQKAIEEARFFRDMAAQILKEYRGFDFTIKWIEGDDSTNNWRFPTVSEDISPYIDAAFNNIDNYENSN